MELAERNKAIIYSSEGTIITHGANRKETKTGGNALREALDRHLTSTAILAALGAVLDAQVTGSRLPPTLQERAGEVLAALGLDGMTEGVSALELKHMLAEIRFMMLLDAKLLLGTTGSQSWSHTETEILQAGGDVSAGFADALTHTIVPRLDGLARRLESPDGSFLDVGVGVAGLAIAMAQQWPSLNVVGLDPWAPSLTLARENVRGAGLTGRIRLVEQPVEGFSDPDAFDLAWLPSPFISEKVILTACERIYRALRPGGWLLFAMLNPGSDPLTASLVRLRTAFWGGCLLDSRQVETLLGQTGFVDIQTLASPPGAIIALTAARRTPNR
jgi:SAM-dependent methyltransferase